MARTRAARCGGLLAGMAVTSVSLSSGFIWACGRDCVADPVVWTPARHELLVFGAALAAWWGYLFAHYAWTGTFIDRSAHGARAHDADHATGRVEHPWVRRVLVTVGAGTLVSGMVVGVVFIRQGNHLMTNVGGALFLGGYLVGHYAETGKPL